MELYVKTDGPETVVKYLRAPVATYVLHAQVTQSCIALTALKTLIMTLHLVNVSVIHAGADQAVRFLTQPVAAANVERTNLTFSHVMV